MERTVAISKKKEQTLDLLVEQASPSRKQMSSQPFLSFRTPQDGSSLQKKKLADRTSATNLQVVGAALPKEKGGRYVWRVSYKIKIVVGRAIYVSSRTIRDSGFVGGSSGRKRDLG
jgi:hypothetical protein